jgi:hypothetical protein
MIEIQCPRCTLHWYSDKPRKGKKRLCIDCAAASRKGTSERPALGLFFFVVVGVLLFEALFLTLVAWFPQVFGVVALGSGSLLCLVGLGWLHFALYGWEPNWRWILEWPSEDADWNEIRWPLLCLVVGLVHVMAWATFARVVGH